MHRQLRFNPYNGKTTLAAIGNVDLQYFPFVMTWLPVSLERVMAFEVIPLKGDYKDHKTLHTKSVPLMKTPLPQNWSSLRKQALT